MKAGTLEIELITNVARLQKEMRDIKRAVGTMQDGVVGDLDNVRKATERAGGGMVGLGKNTKLAAHHVQNFGFQFNDMVVGIMSGQKPLTVFMQQGTQIGQIMQQSGLGVMGFTRAILGMAGAAALAVATNPLFIALAVAVGTAYGAFKLFQSEIGDSGVLKDYVATLGLTKDEMKELGDVTITFGDVMRGTWKTISDALNLGPAFANLKAMAVDAFKAYLGYAKTATAGVYAAFKGTYDGIVATWKSFPAVVGDLAISAANATITAVEWMANKVIAAINKLSGFANSAFEAMGMTTRLGQIGEIKFDRLTNVYAGAGAKAADSFAASYKTAFGQAIKGMDAAGAKWGSDIFGAAKDRLKLKASDILDDRTVKALGAKADEFANNIRDTLSRVFKDINELASNPLKGAGIKINADPLKAWREQRDEQLQFELNLKDLHLQDDLDRRDRMIATANEFADIIGGKLGKVFGGLAQIVEGLNSGNFGGGKLGGMLTLLNQTKGADGKGLIDAFGKKLDAIFGKDGSFAKIIQGAGIGAGMSAFVGGGGTGGRLGGAIGGALGEKLGEKFLSKGFESIAKGLGEFAGPLGSIVGGLAGSLLGGLFSKTKKGSSTLGFSDGQLGVTSTGGNSNSRKQASIQAGGSIVDALLGIADQLGGTLSGVGSGSIGIRKKSFVYDPTGAGRTKGAGVLNFGQDQESAIKAAVADLIKDGAITGLRAGTQALINGKGDIEKQLQKALDFEGVFKELKQATDPTGASLDALATEMTRLRDVFKEAGASAADYAALDQLNAIKKQQILDQAASDALDKLNDRRSLEVRLMQAQGDVAGALALERQMELDSATASLRPLLQQIYAAEDMAEAAAKAQDALDQTADTFRQFADAIKSYRDSLKAESLAMAGSYRSAQVEFIKQSALANAGDKGGLGALPDAARTFLEAAKSSAKSSVQYQRDFGTVLAALGSAAQIADAMASPAGIEQLATQAAAMNGTMQQFAVTVASSGAATEQRLAQMEDRLAAALLAIAQNTSSTDRTLRRAIQDDAMRVTVDEPLPVDTTP